MKTRNLFVALLLAGALSSRGAVIGFDLSPAGTDSAVGLSPHNETPPVASTGSGNEIGSGITFDTATLTLKLSVGFGSAFGFTNLTGAATAADLDGPAPTNTPAPPVTLSLTSLLTSATNPADGGSIVGSVVLTTNEASNLLAGLLSINVSTTNFPGGEIRGQLVPVNVLPTLICPGSTNVECTGDNGTPVQLTAQVADEDGDPLTVIWTANGVPLQTNMVAAGTSSNLTSIVFLGSFPTATNTVTVSVSDGIDAPVDCTATVVVVDTTPPVITSASVTPNELWPPNHKMVPVRISVTATDLCGTVTSKIISITSNQGVLSKGSGHTAPDWKITGDLTAQIRAERDGPDKNGRTYTITIQSTDESGNSATTTVTVFVPHDRGQHANQQPSTPPGNGNSGNNGNGNGNGHGNSGNNGKPPKNH